MRNLKKVLALALATVMMFGMMVVGAGAATYEDVTDSNFGTAIEVMSGIEIIKGNEGNFNPNGNLCRADALLLVGKVVLGEDGLKALTTATATKYSDVPATAYYAGAVAWATKEGYVAGDGAGKFNPLADMSGIGFAKLLLNALGYNSVVEGYVDVAWSEQIININYDAALAGLLKGLEGVDLNKAMTREQAAQMAFNAVTADHRVAYNSELGVVDGQLTTVNTRYEYETNTLTDKFGLQYSKAVGEADPTVGGYWYVLDADGKEVKMSTPADIEANIVLDGYFYDADDVKDEFVLANGKNHTFAKTCGVASYDELYALTGDGRTVYVWTVNDKICKVDYAYETIAVASWTYDDVTELYTFAVGTDDITYIKDAKTAAEKLNNVKYEQLVALNIAEEGTYISVGTYDDGTKSWNGYALPTSVTAKADNIGANGTSVKLNGKVNYAAVDSATAVAKVLNTVDMAKEYTYYFDSTGHIIHVELAGKAPAPAGALYLYVTGVEYTAGKLQADGTYELNYTVTGVDLTGAEKSINVGKTNTLKAGDFVTYKIDKDGVFTSEAVTLGETVKFDATTDLRFDSKFVTEDSQFVYLRTKKDTKGNDVYYITTVTGAHGINAGVKFVNLTKDTSKDLTLVVLAGDPATPAEKPSEDYLYVAYSNNKFNYYTLAADGETKLCNYTIYIDGEKQIVPVDKINGKDVDGTIASACFYTYTVKDGVYTLNVIENNDGVRNSWNLHYKGENCIILGNGRYYVDINGTLIDITDAVVYNMTKKSANSVERLYTLANSDSIGDIYVAIKWTTDSVTKLNFAEAIYVTTIKDAE